MSSIVCVVPLGTSNSHVTVAFPVHQPEKVCRRATAVDWGSTRSLAGARR
ncbi:MAG TPA: hypothetical protein VF367_05125 [Candidatus Limnocylindria bacterium]